MKEDRDSKIRTAYSKIFLPDMIRKAATNLQLVPQYDRDINTVLEFNKSREKNEVRSSLNKIPINANKQTVYSKRSPMMQQKTTALDI